MLQDVRFFLRGPAGVPEEVWSSIDWTLNGDVLSLDSSVLQKFREIISRRDEIVKTWERREILFQRMWRVLAPVSIVALQAIMSWTKHQDLPYEVFAVSGFCALFCLKRSCQGAEERLAWDSLHREPPPEPIHLDVLLDELPYWG